MMNIQIANRLVEMRKEKGLSQEALAEQLGISRQAVSKWERAESSPDTSNLITLAKLYGISLDQLLDTDQEKFESAEPLNGADNQNEPVDTVNKNTEDFVRIGVNGVHVKDGEDEVRVGWNGIRVTENGNEVVSIGKSGVIVDGEEYKRQWKADGLITLLIVATYLFLGAVHSLWHPGWLIFFLIPISTSFISAVRRKNLGEFSFSVLVFGGILTAIIVYDMPRTTWFALILIPIFNEIVKMFKGQKSNIKVNANMEKGFNIQFGDDEDVDVQVSFNGKDEEEKEGFSSVEDI